VLWSDIRSIPGCKKVVLPDTCSSVYLFETPDNKSNWMVAKYKDLTTIATALRTNRNLRGFLSDHTVRLGLRATDVPPADLERQKRYGAKISGINHATDFTLGRINHTTPPVHSNVAAPGNRRGDREQNVKMFWETQTPQSHHIVENNNLRNLGASSRDQSSPGEMDYKQLPAVLLTAEFHQRYITAVLRPAQSWGKEKLERDVTNEYRKLYCNRSSLFKPLWNISMVTLRAAGIPVA
jgi:hypothetical protein